MHREGIFTKKFVNSWYISAAEGGNFSVRCFFLFFMVISVIGINENLGYNMEYKQERNIL